MYSLKMLKLEAFAPARLLEKEDGSKIKKGEEAEFRSNRIQQRIQES